MNKNTQVPSILLLPVIMSLIISLAIIVGFAINRTYPQRVELDGSYMIVNSRCADVVRASGITDPHRIHSELSGTAAYVKACF